MTPKQLRSLIDYAVGLAEIDSISSRVAADRAMLLAFEAGWVVPDATGTITVSDEVYDWLVSDDEVAS